MKRLTTILFCLLLCFSFLSFANDEKKQQMISNIFELETLLDEAIANNEKERIHILSTQLEDAKDVYKSYRAELKAIEDFKGFDWGIGTAMMFFADEGLIDVAIIDDNGIVRVEREGIVAPSIMFEAHHFWVVDGESGKIGVGPFVGMLTDPSGDLLDALALGGMVGLRRLGNGNDNSLNFGFGYVWNRNCKILAAGMYENEPLPAGESEIRYKYKTLGGFIVMISFAF